MFPGPLGVSLTGKALERKLWGLEVVNIRDFGIGKHKSVDDTPFGGDQGMLIKADVLGSAIESKKVGKLYYLSPRGKVFNQKKAHQILNEQNVGFICGRFEGIDQRVIDYYEIEELSLGQFVLSGGELAVYLVLDACVRLIPGVLGNELSTKTESFAVGSEYENLTEYPQYTKPRVWNGLAVPEVLLSGDHGKISKWRLEKAKSQSVTP